MLYDAEGNTLFQGVSFFAIQPVPASDPRALRIVVPVGIEGNYTQAVVDTGGMYFVCDAELAQLLDVDVNVNVGRDTLYIRGKRVQGRLYRLVIELTAAIGSSVSAEVTAFIPDKPTEWDLLPYMGFQYCLERFRFAIDTEAERFYFGSYSWP